MEDSAPVDLKLTPKAAKALRSRVYRPVIGMIVLFLTFARGFLGHEIDTHLAGLHLPAGFVFPAGAAVIAAVTAYLGAILGKDKNSTLFDGLLDTLRGTPAAEIPPPPMFVPRDGMFAPDAGQTPAAVPASDLPAPTNPGPLLAEPPPPPEPVAAPEPEPDHEADAAALNEAMMATYADTAGVTFTDEPDDPFGPHGVNYPGETDGAPDPGEPA